MESAGVSRRSFIKSTGAATAIVAGASAALPRNLKAQTPGPNDRLRIGFIGVGGRAHTHLASAISLANEGKVEIAAVCDVFNRYIHRAINKVQRGCKQQPKSTGDYRSIISDPTIDAVCIATPDHWHAKQTLDALAAGKHVYCEKPMTHSVEEAIQVYRAWKESGKVMQVGVQSTSLPVWSDVNRRLCDGQLGKVLMYQTSYFRNSDLGQWRYYELAPDMTPSNIDWQMFLGTEFGLAPKMPFDRARFAQWRCYWDFGAGMFTDLFVHRTSVMLKATGLRFPGRVVGAGGIYLEYDDRDVPDVATVVADFPEGVQGLVTSTMCCEGTPVPQIIRGHLGSFLLGDGEEISRYDFVAERPQVTHNSSIKNEHYEEAGLKNSSLTHFTNFVEAAMAGKPGDVNCSPEIGAAAMVIVKLGALSYRQGKVFHFDPETLAVKDGSSSWASQWEKMSHERASARHVPNWRAGDIGSTITPRPYQKLAGPWINGIDPAAGSKSSAD
ncbi:MAG: Gfo/Idh/MocA family oxidoreductase [Pirellulales bacterium]|nr:Gfo/Idh/MocA family oxidoreductase [Pirellulales bacterium]